MAVSVEIISQRDYSLLKHANVLINLMDLDQILVMGYGFESNVFTDNIKPR